MIWNETVYANCTRESRSAVRSIDRSSSLSCDPLGMGEHLEPVVACDADESKAYRLCSADGQSRRRRDADYDDRSHHAGLLHKFDRNTARQHNDAQRSRLAGMQQSTRQLVERIVPPDVLTQDQLPTRPPKCCSMDRAGLH